MSGANPLLSSAAGVPSVSPVLTSTVGPGMGGTSAVQLAGTVSAGIGRAATVGPLSVPSTWANATPAVPRIPAATGVASAAVSPVSAGVGATPSLPSINVPGRLGPRSLRRWPRPPKPWHLARQPSRQAARRMNYVIADPDAIGTAADELQGIGSALEATNAAAAAPTTGVLPPATDSVSARTAAFLDAQAAQYQALSAQAELFHNQFVQTLITAQNAYAEAEVSNTAALQSTSGNQIALIMGGTGNPTPSDAYLQEVYQTFVLPNYPGYSAKGRYTPEQLWPLTGINSQTFGQSVQEGIAILNNAIMTHSAAGDQLLVVGYSQSATIATMEMRYLDSLPAVLRPSPNLLNFMMLADPNNPVTGGILTRFIPGFFTGFHVPTPLDTIYTTAIYGIQYDPVAQFPAGIFNISADLNALFGFPLHTQTPLLTAAQLATAIQQQIGNTTYFIVPTMNLPLLDPLRMIPILGNPLADLLQPFLQPLVEFGYATGLPGPLQSISSLAIAGASPGISVPLATGLPPLASVAVANGF
ncbi:PPE family protein, SVP subgroup [Mycobacterium stomatepiae]